ncbi:MAG: N-acetylmuramic acid 6-phosphate etherase, partial [Frankiaceae bacterium]|nr:N-acetylmuramic acid 6-phosphate etherase [Frankiaceae bacterium]
MAEDLTRLRTEQDRPGFEDLDLRPTRELVELMNDDDASVAIVVRAVSGQVAAAVDAVAGRVAAGGRLIYVGAGTAGRIAALDALECPATFGVPKGTVIALVAGGSAAFTDP